MRRGSGNHSCRTFFLVAADSGGMDRIRGGMDRRTVHHLLFPKPVAAAVSGRRSRIFAGGRNDRRARGGRRKGIFQGQPDRGIGLHVDLERAHQLVPGFGNGRLLPASPRAVPGGMASEIVGRQRTDDDGRGHGRTKNHVPPDRRHGSPEDRLLRPRRAPRRTKFAVRIHQVRLAGRSVPTAGRRRPGQARRQGGRYADADRTVEKAVISAGLRRNPHLEDQDIPTLETQIIFIL